MATPQGSVRPQRSVDKGCANVITRAEPETGARLTRGSASNSFAALAQPNRFRIVEPLRTGPRSVNNIGERPRLNQSQASKHLCVLREAGLVDVRKRARQRFNELRGEALHRLHEWLERYRQLWDAREAKQTVPSASRSDQGVDDAVQRVRHLRVAPRRLLSPHNRGRSCGGRTEPPRTEDAFGRERRSAHGIGFHARVPGMTTTLRDGSAACAH